MRQWHRCDRWERHRLGCPFTVDEDHERAESDPEPLVFSKLFAKDPTTPGVSGQPPAFQTAAVATKKKQPALVAAGAAHPPQESYLDLLGIPEANPALEPVLGKIVDAVTQIPRAWQAPRWITREDFAKIGIGETTDVRVALSEEAVAEGVSRFPGQMLPFMAIPLLEAFRRLVTKTTRPGVMGTPGGPGPTSTYNPLKEYPRTGKHDTPQPAFRPRGPAKSPVPATTRGGGGLSVNMNAWFLNKFGAGPRRKASPGAPEGNQRRGVSFDRGAAPRRGEGG